MCRDPELGRSLRIATYRSGKLVLLPDDDGTFNAEFRGPKNS